MRTSKLVLSLSVVLFMAGACSFSMSSANISSVKLGKDKAVSQEATTFAAADTIYAVAVISNSPGKVGVKGRLVIEDVAGQQAGPIPGLENTVNLDASGTATFTFSPPAAGWPAGKYKFEVLMLNENGEQKDQKTVSFTVS